MATKFISDQPPVSIHVGPLPGRKQIALYIEETHLWIDEDGNKKLGGSIRTLAFFRKQEDADLALALIDLLAGARPGDPGMYKRISPERMIRKQK